MPARTIASKRTRKTPRQSAAALNRARRRRLGPSAAEPRSAPQAQAKPSIGLGPRLRQARVAEGLSARELARRIGVSPSLISQIERDLAMPSVATLFAIANELGLVIDDLFRGDGAAVRSSAATPVHSRPSPVQRHHERAVIRLNTGVRWERLTPAPDQDVEFLYVVYDVGGATAEDGLLFRHGGKEYGVVVSGRLGIQIGFERYELAPGDSVTFDARTPHRLWTIGDQPVTAIFAILGRHGDPRTASAAPARQAEPVDG